MPGLGLSGARRCRDWRLEPGGNGDTAGAEQNYLNHFAVTIIPGTQDHNKENYPLEHLPLSVSCPLSCPFDSPLFAYSSIMFVIHSPNARPREP